MMNIRTACVAAVASACFAAAPALAGTVDFETIPGGIPAEGVEISTQYLASEGMSFSLENGQFPMLVEIGGQEIGGFLGPNGFVFNGLIDTPAPGQNVGNFYLADNNTIEMLGPSPLIVSFAAPVAKAGAVIIDVDSEESFLIEAFGADGLLSSITIAAGDPDTGDGIATAFGFEFINDVITSLRISYTGASLWTGYCLDNFTTEFASNNPPPPPVTPLSVPLPAAAWPVIGMLSSLGLIAGGKRLRRRG
jgi:hypothetical protein